MVVASASLNTPTILNLTIKFLCRYGGKILPRHPDGKLRYHGGETRILSVDASISFSELLVKLGELCGTSVILRCQLPSEDLDALVTITSNEDLANLIEEYDRFPSPSSSLKIRAFLSLPKSTKKISSSPSTASSSTSTTASPRASSFTIAGGRSYTSRFPAADRCIRQMWKPVGFPLKSVEKLPYCGQGNPSCMYLIHNGSHWQ